MIWILASLFAGIMGAFSVEVNRYYKVDGVLLNLWRGVVALVILLPFVPFMYWPQAPWFYLVASLLGAVMFVNTVITSNLSAQGRGRVSQLQLPVKVFIAFVAWFLIERTAWAAFIGEPKQVIGVSISLFLAVISMQFIRKNDSSWRTLLEVAPIGFMFAIIDIMVKKVITSDMPDIPTVLTLSLIALIASLSCSVCWVVGRPKPGRQLVSKPLLQAGVLVGVSLLICFFLVNYAIVLSPNPAYVSIFLLLVPVWIGIWHWFNKVPDDASPRAGLALVASAIILIWATQG